MKLEEFEIKEESMQELCIEVTRHCNLDCTHCLRGDAQKKHFDYTFLVEFLRKTGVRNISSLTLTGGEPLLRPDIIDQIIETLKLFDVSVGNFYIATNGTAFTKKSLQVIGKLYSHCYEKEMCYINISNSIYHEEAIKRLGGYIPQINSMEDISESFDWFNDVVQGMYGWDIPEIDIRREPQNQLSYEPHNLLGEGRGKGTGNEARRQESLYYINVEKEIIIGYCDLSYESQVGYVKGEYILSDDYNIAS